MLRSVVYRLGARGGSALLQAVSVVLLARGLGPEGYGFYSLGVWIGIIVGIVTMGGLPTFALHVATESDAALLRNAMTLWRYAASTGAALVTALVLWLASHELGIALPLAIIVVSDLIADYEQAIQAGLARQRLSANLVLLQRLVPTVFLAALHTTGHEEFLLLGYALGSALMLVAVTILALKRAVAGRASLKRVVSAVKGDWMAGVTGSIYMLDVPIVSVLLGVGGLGLYSAASRMATGPMNVLSTALFTVLLSTASQSTPGGAYGRVFATALSRAYLALGLVVLASPWLSWLAGELLGGNYAQARPLIAGLLVASGLFLVVQVHRARLLRGKHGRTVAACLGGSNALGLSALALASAFGGPMHLWIGPVVTNAAALLSLKFAWRRILKGRIGFGNGTGVAS